MTQKPIVAAAIAGLFALAAGSAMAQDVKPGQEKCWGAAKAGQNDCGSNKTAHSCAAQSTAPCAWCARMLAMDVNMMVAIAVPRATWRMCADAMPCAVNTSTSMGTITAPPPIPSRPARKPTAAPIAR